MVSFQHGDKPLAAQQCPMPEHGGIPGANAIRTPLIRSRHGQRADIQRRGAVDRAGRRNGDLGLEAIVNFQHDTSPCGGTRATSRSGTLNT